MAQAVHAARGWSEFEAIVGDKFDPNNETVVILEVDDVEEWSNKLTIPHFLFKEPYWKGLATALASKYIDPEMVKDLKLA